MKTLIKSLALLALMTGLVASSAFAAPSKGSGHSTADQLFGGVVKGRGHLNLGIGYPAMPRLSVTYGIGNSFEVGGELGILLGWYAPTGGINAGMSVGVPMRWRLVNNSQFTSGLKFNPGFLFSFSPVVPGFFADLRWSGGVKVGRRAIIGFGAGMPFAMLISAAGVGVGIPILFGPEVEVDIARSIAGSFRAQFGPLIAAGGGGSTVNFGMDVGAGLHYRF